MRLRKREVEEGTFLALRDAQIVRDERFRPDLDYREPVALPAVRAPQEGDSCLERLARARGRLAASSAAARPSTTRTPCSSRRSRTRNWNVDQAPRRASSIR